MKHLSLLFALITTPALAADPVLSFVFKSEKLVLGENDIQYAEPGFDDQAGIALVSFVLSPERQQEFAKLTARHIGETMDIVVCEKLITSPVITSAMEGGQLQISGAMTEDEAGLLAVTLDTGSC
jgi:preprotein translocase subunit SecD